MTTQTAIKVAAASPNKIEYAVSTPTREVSVTVTRAGKYQCSCGSHQLYGECRHTAEVQARRLAQGRQF